MASNNSAPVYQAAYGDSTAFLQAPQDAYTPLNNNNSSNKDRGGLLSHAKDYLPHLTDIQAIKDELEGPRPLRVIAGLGGFALAVGSALGLINVVSLLTHPSQFVLRAYETLFGLLIAVIELKAFFQPGNKLREFCYKWFPFLTILAGKGAFYIFAGMMGVGFGWLHLLVFVPAVFCTAMGVVYVLFHFGRCNELRQKYDQTVMGNNGGAVEAAYLATPQRPPYDYA